jgi:hypothetical protein
MFSICTSDRAISPPRQGQRVGIDVKEMCIHVTDYAVDAHLSGNCDRDIGIWRVQSDLHRTVRRGLHWAQKRIDQHCGASLGRRCFRVLRFRKTDGWHDGTCGFLDPTAIDFLFFFREFPEQPRSRP